MKAPSIFIFIPAYEAEATLPDLFNRFTPDLWQRIQAVWILDDGSADRTADVARELCEGYPKLGLRSYARNRGYGSMVKEGLSLAKEAFARYAVCLHADGQYPPERIAEFVDHMHARGIDLLQGSRHRDGTALAGGMPRYKLVAGKALTFLENLSFGLSMTDYHSGFLLYGSRALREIPFGALSGSFDFDLEVIACARAGGLQIGELGIATRYAEEKSHLNPMTYGLRVLDVLRKYHTGRYALMMRKGETKE